MKRALFLIATVTLVFVLSSCAEIIEGLLMESTNFKFHNRSSYAVNVYVSRRAYNDKTFTLRPGDSKFVDDRGVGTLDYTYTPSDLVATGAVWDWNSIRITGYDFWDK